MSEFEVNIEEQEPTLEELEAMAVKQLSIELMYLQRHIFNTGTVLNGMLIVQVRGIIKGLMSKYQSQGLFVDETLTLKVTGYRANDSIYFDPSPRLRDMLKDVRTEIESQIKENSNA